MTTIARRFFSRFVLLSFVFSVFAVAQLIPGTGICHAQTQPASTKAASGVAKAAPAAQKLATQPRASGMSTGIQISGRWVIEVKNPDGKVTARREFENNIQPTGMTYLAVLLAGNNSPGQLSIMLNGAGSPQFTSASITLAPGESSSQPCMGGIAGNFTFAGACVITAAPNNSYTSGLGYICFLVPQSCSTNLSITAQTISNSNYGNGLSSSLTLSGNVVANSGTGGNITDVETIFETCSNGSTPSGCKSLNDVKNGLIKTSVNWDAMNLFTEANNLSVPYTPGQTIQATVTFTFSSPTS